MSTAKSFIRRSSSILAWVASVGLVSACMPTGEDPTTLPGQQGRCKAISVHKIHPKKIQSGKTLFFDPADFAALFSGKGQVKNLVFRLSLEGKFEANRDDLPLDFNGISAFNDSHEPIISCAGYSHSSNRTDCTMKLEKMRLNGAEPVEFAIFRILKNHGEMRLSHHHKTFHLPEGWIQFERWVETVCSSPTPEPEPTPTLIPPTPTPSPEPLPAPVTFIVAVTPSAPVVNSTSMVVDFGSDQINVTYQCSLDQSPLSLCVSPALYSGLSNGVHTVKVVAINSEGTADPDGTSYTWTIDTVPPDVTISNAAELPTLTRQTAVSFTISSTDAASLQCSMDGAEFAPCVSPVNYVALAEGEHRFAVRGVDAVGNVSAQAASFQWAIDLTPPQAYFVSVLPGRVNDNANEETFAFAAGETSTFECAVEDGAFAECISPVALTGLSEGQHAFKVRAIDVAGNVGQALGFLWNVDLTSPVLNLGGVIPPVGLTNATQVSVEFAANEPVSYTCSYDGGPEQNCVSPFGAPVLSEGPHSVTIFATDLSGNRSGFTTVDWVMDFTRPAIAWGPMVPSAASFINMPDLSAEVTYLEPSSLACTLNEMPIADVASPIRLVGLSEGAYTLAAMPIDAAGNAGDAIFHSFTVDMTGPSVALEAQFSGRVSETINVLSFGSDEEATFECNSDHMGFSPCSSPVGVSGLAEGEHQFEVRATDRAGNVGESAIFDWVVDLAPPVSTITAERTQNRSITLSFTANEPVSGFECSLDGAAFAGCGTPVALSNLEIGSHVFLVRGTDVAGNVESNPARYEWTVDPIPTTLITGVTVGSLTNQKTATFTFTASAAGSSFVCTLDGGMAVACASPWVLSNLSEGSHTAFIQATNRWGERDPMGATFSWSVDSVAPSVTSYGITTTSSSVTINWVTSEPATSKVNWGVGSDTSRVIAEDNVYVTNHSVKIMGLSSGTYYSVIVSGHDAAGNAYTSVKKTARTL